MALSYRLTKFKESESSKYSPVEVLLSNFSRKSTADRDPFFVLKAMK
jgi:hypothetical protein